MKLEEIGAADLRAQLRGPGLDLAVGPLRVRLHSDVAAFAQNLALLYAGYEVSEPFEFADFHVSVRRGQGIRRYWRPQARFVLDAFEPFKPLPLSQAFAFFEWGMNWCVAQHLNEWLIVHAAVLERGGRALIMPGPPGSGKSTLAAALVWRGWRLLSDELALFGLGSAELIPVPRPVNLKNRSIDVIKSFAPEAVFGSEAHDTAKGIVAHMRPPTDAIDRAGEPAAPRWVVFPRWEEGAALSLDRRSRALTSIDLGRNAFNYSILGEAGFDTLCRALDQCMCFDLSYSGLDECVEALEVLSCEP